MPFKLKKKKTKFLWTIYILKYVLPIFFVTFFGQTFLLIVSILECRNGKTYNDSKLSCSNTFFYILLPISIIAALMKIFISIITVSMYYKQDYIQIKGNSVIVKRNSLSDISLLLNKIIIIFIFVLDKQSEFEHWGIIIFLSLITGFNAYVNFVFQSYSNLTIKKLNKFLSLTLFWSFIVLLIQKILLNADFNGGIYLYFLGILLIILFSFYYNINYSNFLYINFNNINSSQNCLDYIKQYLNMIDEKDRTRDSLLIFNSFIEKNEEKCTNKRCALKKYLESLSKGIYSKFLLLQYAEKLFKIAISKFPEDINLKINYAVFLYTKINKKKEGKTELFLIKPKFFSFNDKFNLYICKKYIEEYLLLINDKNKEKIKTFNMIQALEYKKIFNEFKELIIKTSSLYYDFWSSLYSSHIQGTEDFMKLNDIGNQINKLTEKINKTFSKLNQMKRNDYEMLKLYESFIKSIINNEDKYKQFHDISINLVNYNIFKTKEIDFSNFDLGSLNESNENGYLIVSIDEENKGKILNISLSACPILGYCKNDIIGKNINILIPELFQKMHNKVFNNVTEKIKTEFYDNLVNKIIYKPQSIELYVHGKNKSKYLIPLQLKIYLVQTEESELVYIVEINRNDSFNGELNDTFKDNSNENNINENICCILVDNNLKINTFTSNCATLLKLNSNVINSNYDITSFIRQLNDDFQTNVSLSNKDCLDLEYSEMVNDDGLYKIYEESSNKKNNINSIINKSIENKLKNKKKLIKSKFLCPRLITWKIESNDKASILYSEKMKKKTLSLILSKDHPENSTDKFENNFIMLVREAYISDKHIGYFFYFKSLNNANSKNKTVKLNQELRMNRNSLFKFVSIEEGSNNPNTQGEESPKIKNPKRSLPHKSSMHALRNVSQQVNFNLENQDENIINSAYIPDSNFNFILDYSDFKSFKPSFEIQSSTELIEKLKNESINKLRIFHETSRPVKSSSLSKSPSISSKEEDEFSVENNSNSSFYSYGLNSSTITNDFKKEESNRKNIITNKNINIKFNNDYHEQYYKVNIKNIKFIIYDFNGEKFVNSENDKISQMEKIKEKCKATKNILTNEDDKYPSFSNLNISEEKINQTINTKIKIINQDQNISKFEKEKDLKKEIMDSLSKKDEQSTVVQFYGILIICTLIFLVVNILEMIYILVSYDSFAQNMKLLINSINLKYYSNFNVYFLREHLLTIAFFAGVSSEYGNNYKSYPLTNNSIEYKNEVYKLLNFGFYQSHSLIEKIFMTELSLSKNASNIINKMPYYSETLYNKTKFKKNKTSLSVSIIYVYSFILKILSNQEDLYFSYNEESFNYLHNAMNNLGKALKILIEVYNTELKLRQSGIIKNVIFIMCINLIIYLAIYYINNINYYNVITKKISYLSLFYEIKLPLIKSSIKKCQAFMNRLNKEEIKYGRILEVRREESINSYTSSNSRTNNTNSVVEGKKKVNNYKKEEKNTEIKKIEIDVKYRKFQILFIIILLISFSFLSMIILLYFYNIKIFMAVVEYSLHMENYQNNIIELYNSYREFLINENFIISGMPSYEFLIYKEKEIYSSNTQDIKFLIIKENLFKNVIKEINKTPLNDLYKDDFFKSKEEFEEYLGGKEGITNYGFEVLINYFIEEIRMKRNYVNMLINKQILVGNISEINNNDMDDYSLGLINNKTLIFRLNLFNMDDIHNKLNVIFLHIIYQYINNERNLTLNMIINNLDHRQLSYIILIVCHCALIISSILFYWSPKVKKMNVEIYKAKNMLSIIPVQILISLPNIKKVLNIVTAKAY